jgi:3-dehydroquinate synthase
VVVNYSGQTSKSKHPPDDKMSIVTAYREIKVDLKEQGYPICIGDQIISLLPEKLDQLSVNRQIAIISALSVSNLYLKEVAALFNPAWEVITHIVPDGEISKSPAEVDKIYTWLIERHFERRSTLIALGGGVVGDLSGFVAATFLRGVNLVQLPTTLLAQVDSSIGGKVGINHPLGKNLIGAFYQPKLVLTDVAFLNSLPMEEYICGLGEVVKYGILGSKTLFELLENNLERILKKDQSLLQQIVFDCAQIKAKIVEKDVYEQSSRASLNLGHTFGHALETFYKSEGLKHGQAVLLGMRCAIHAARQLDLIDSGSAGRMNRLLKRIDVQLPTQKKIDPAALLAIMKRDKKVRDGQINLVLPQRIGKVIVRPVSDENLLKTGFEILQDQ